jgi:hypothetical protein
VEEEETMALTRHAKVNPYFCVILPRGKIAGGAGRFFSLNSHEKAKTRVASAFPVD